MPVVAVINRKGGSGKSTLATHLAGHCAQKGLRVMLGDVDRQQSSLSWLRRRDAHAAPRPAPIAGWAVGPNSVMRAPSGITHVVLDTPGGLHGSDLARTVMYADAVLMPVCHSAFDRESATDCYAELMTLPRVASGRCKIALVGMRLDGRTRAGTDLVAWAEAHRLPYIGALRETQVYVRLVEQGLTLFDLSPAKAEADLQQWEPILEWLHKAWRSAGQAEQAAKAPARPVDGRPEPARAAVAMSARPIRPTPARRPAPALAQPVTVPARRAQGGPLDWLFGVFR